MHAKYVDEKLWENSSEKSVPWVDCLRQWEEVAGGGTVDPAAVVLSELIEFFGLHGGNSVIPHPNFGLFALWRLQAAVGSRSNYSG